ncbi:MAG: ATP-binding cassette domain-containing protein [Bacteroidia bacterium]
MIELEKIHLSFNTGTPLEVIALNDVSLRLEKGSFNLVVGSNGSGKSTLLNVMAGTLFPLRGKIMLANTDLSKMPVNARSKYIARIFQDPTKGTSPNLSLLENFRIASLRTSNKRPFIGIDKGFRKVVASHVSILDMGLEERLDQPMSSFSGGQRQALSLLMATFDHLDLLLLDEPTAALDPKSAELVMDLTMKIAREKNFTSLMVTHNLKHCLYPVDRILQMENGWIRRDVDPEEKAELSLNDIRDWFI